jgi:hypothetical protein
MAKRNLPHDSTACRFCDDIPADVYRRHWKHEAKAGIWHVLADASNLMARLPRHAHFLTVLAYRFGPEREPHYQGPLYFEFDSHNHNPADALSDLRRCLSIIEVEYDFPLEALHIWHSGRRGFHGTMPPIVIGAEAGHPHLPRIYRAMIQRLFPPSVAPLLDWSVYNEGRGRMWRLPNRQRSDSKRYKVPLSMHEVLHKSYADLDALTLRPRKGIFWPSDEELSPCLGLAQLYAETMAVLEPDYSRHSHHGYVASETEGEVDILLSRCAFVRHCRDEAPRLREPEWFAMISNVSRCTDGPAAVHRLSEPYPGYSPQETDAKIAHALQDTGPHTCAFIQAMGYQGCPPGGCGVKAPIGLTRQGSPAYDPWLGPRSQWQGVPTPIWKEADR